MISFLVVGVETILLLFVAPLLTAEFTEATSVSVAYRTELPFLGSEGNAVNALLVTIPAAHQVTAPVL